MLAGLEQQRAAEEAGRRAAELGAAITAEHELQGQRDDLLRAVSHDLRAPLTAIRGRPSSWSAACKLPARTAA